MRRVGVVIPVYNEVDTISACLQGLYGVLGDSLTSVVVVDGHPQQTTLNHLQSVSAEHPLLSLASSSPGRGVQLDLGAKRTQSDVLLFLHADTRLPANTVELIDKQLNREPRSVGAFSLSLDQQRWDLNWVARTASWRARFLGWPYGDQAYFMTRDVYIEVGGFAPLPIMEDVDFIKRAKHLKIPIRVQREAVVSSARRWMDEGTVRRTLKNWWLLTRFACGVSPERLVRDYTPPQTMPSQSQDVTS